jgi:hypothetical protein
MEKLSDKAERNVRAKYPDVRHERDGAFFFIITGKGRNKKELGAGFTLNGAWCSAGCSLSKTESK